MTPAPVPTIDDEAAPRECPFCGAEMVLRDHLNIGSYWMHPSTKGCQASRNILWSPADIAAWNRRAPDEAMRARIVAAEAENELQWQPIDDKARDADLVLLRRHDGCSRYQYVLASWRPDKDPEYPWHGEYDSYPEHRYDECAILPIDAALAGPS